MATHSVSAVAAEPQTIEALNFLTEDQARSVAETFGTPAYVYDEATLKRQARAALAFERTTPEPDTLDTTAYRGCCHLYPGQRVTLMFRVA